MTNFEAFRNTEEWSNTVLSLGILSINLNLRRKLQNKVVKIYAN